MHKMRQQALRATRGWALTASVGLGLAALAGSAQAGSLNISIGVTDATQRHAFTQLAEDFHAANPDVEVRLTLTDLAAHRKALPAQLEGEAPDVFNWFAGDQMRSFAQHGLLEDVSDLWKANTWWNSFPQTAAAATWADKPWGLPYQTYTWGIFWRHDVMERAGISAAPRDLGALLNACSRLNKAGFTPVALGGHDGWALAAWFDYLDLRTNGLEKHQQLTDGKLSYADRDVQRTFQMWRQLIEAKCFSPTAASTDNATALGQFNGGHAAMILLGTNASASFPEALKGTIEFAHFPLIDVSLPLAEAAPTDNFHIAARAHNKADARRFLKFVGSSAANAKLAKSLGSFPTNKFAPVAGTVLDLSAYKVLTEAKGGLVQAYDRDTPADMAQVGIKAMQEFLAQPQTYGKMLAKLDEARAVSYRGNALETLPATAAGKARK